MNARVSWLSTVVVVAVAGLALVAAPREASAQAEAKIGVGMVPYLNGGDDAEQGMHNVVGQFPQVKMMFNPETPGDMFATLKKLKKAGKKVDFLVIAGHGSKATPGVTLAGGDVTPGDVDLPGMRAKRAIAERAVNDPATKDKAGAKKSLAAINQQIDDLEAVAEVMAPGATVVLINCSPAATDAGQAFVKNLGEVLIGKNGGVVVASKSDVQIGQVRSVANLIRARLSGDPAQFGEFFITGDWVTFDIPDAADASDLLGTWTSDWGPVTFAGKPARGKTVSFTGHWIQSKTQRGQIKGGSFDLRSRRATFTYYQHWNKQNGRADLTISADGKSMSGTWTQGNGSGSWTMTR